MSQSMSDGAQPLATLRQWLLLVLLSAAAVAATLASLPFWRYHFGDVPFPGTAPRYVGEVRVVGELEWVGKGWRPPRYFIETDSGPVEFRCGFWPSFTTCPVPNRSREGRVFEVGIDPIWGVDYIKYPKVRGYIDVWSGYQMDVFRAKQVRGRLYYVLVSFVLGFIILLKAIKLGMQVSNFLNWGK